MVLKDNLAITVIEFRLFLCLYSFKLHYSWTLKEPSVAAHSLHPQNDLPPVVIIA